MEGSRPHSSENLSVKFFNARCLVLILVLILVLKNKTGLGYIGSSPAQGDC